MPGGERDVAMHGAEPCRQSDDDWSDEEAEEHKWVLGFVEPTVSEHDLLRHRFPSKVGGRPAWLNPVGLPAPEQLVGPDGQTPLSFLLQAGFVYWLMSWTLRMHFCIYF